MSTRFPMPGEPGSDAPAMPNLPSGPNMIAAGAGARLPVKQPEQSGGVKLDLDTFRDPNFNPDTCMTSISIACSG